jgi:hypothetical protein
MGLSISWGGRGAFRSQRRLTVRAAGANGSENAGMSSVQTRENRVRRKSKVSDARSFRVGLVGPLAEAERRRRWTSG